jgi:ATP-dependent Clp protease adaptor protein ClpS
MARVLLLNDDETTMEFVVQVLEGVERASEIVARVTELARRNRYPMRCIIAPTSRV